MQMLDIYTDYLISQNKYATATGLSDLVNGVISHDQVSRFLRKNVLGSKESYGSMSNQAFVSVRLDPRPGSW
ncbi:hypothetical protein CAB17_08925 [Legionella sainthelensi]|uniref:Uncharacterized protein n=1 Tax=Legionella sainthelensi TaxID=28087 RepID=A0A2H5FKV9_9GAMM|nr:hypothetical protein [Legionella sainthelensi]AUH72172.1 hypothetical protein CAB17_08925 [Legionella sainthelensi]